MERFGGLISSKARYFHSHERIAILQKVAVRVESVLKTPPTAFSFPNLFFLMDMGVLLACRSVHPGVTDGCGVELGCSELCGGTQLV